MSCCGGGLAADCVARAANVSHLARLEELRAAGRRLPGGGVAYSLNVPAIRCGQCISTIERAIGKLEGVASARVNLSLRRLALVLDGPDRSPLDALELLERLGYPAAPLDVADSNYAHAALTGELVRALGVAGFASANIMLLSVSVWSGADGATRDLFHLISAGIAIPAIAWSGQVFFRSALAAIRSGRLNMDVPITIGILLAVGMSLYESLSGGPEAYFDASVTLLFFLLIGRTLDHVMRERARHAVAGLGRLSARGGLAVTADGSLAYLPLDEIRPGMTLRIAAGERAPVDGEVIAGTSDVDRSLVTGESLPERVSTGAKLESGVLNLTGPIDIRATKDAKSSFLADVAAMMEAAEHGRGRYVRLADRMARYYSPVVHLVALSAFLGWMAHTGGDWRQSLMIAIATLIITCPCALGLAVPVAHVIGAVRMFEAGILMKDGSALERLGEATHAVFDKTGTLTTGTPEAARTAIPSKYAAIAKAMALSSLHPASRALARHLHGEPSGDLSGISEVPGCGIETSIGRRRARLGRGEWVGEIVSTDATAGKGLSFGMEGGRAYATELRETLRDGAAAIAGVLAKDGIASEILSGDSEPGVAAIARQTGIGRFQFGLRPHEKIVRLEALRAEGRRVLMVGDGLNDAPALSAAHVSFVPASATDIGRRAADFVFTRESLDAVTHARTIALATGRIVKQNLALAIGYNLLAVPLAVAGHVTPLVAAIAMSTSSIIVIANSMRLFLLPGIGGEPAAPRRVGAERAPPANAPEFAVELQRANI